MVHVENASYMGVLCCPCLGRVRATDAGIGGAPIEEENPCTTPRLRELSRQLRLGTLSCTEGIQLLRGLCGDAVHRLFLEGNRHDAQTMSDVLDTCNERISALQPVCTVRRGTDVQAAPTPSTPEGAAASPPCAPGKVRASAAEMTAPHVDLADILRINVDRGVVAAALTSLPPPPVLPAVPAHVHAIVGPTSTSAPGSQPPSDQTVTKRRRRSSASEVYRRTASMALDRALSPLLQQVVARLLMRLQLAAGLEDTTSETCAGDADATCSELFKREASDALHAKLGDDGPPTATAPAAARPAVDARMEQEISKVAS